jgi:hypothetical protein
MLRQFIIVLLLEILAIKSCSGSFVAPADPRITYHGRFDFSQLNSDKVW